MTLMGVVPVFVVLCLGSEAVAQIARQCVSPFVFSALVFNFQSSTFRYIYHRLTIAGLVAVKSCDRPVNADEKKDHLSCLDGSKSQNYRLINCLLRKIIGLECSNL